jgi:DNA-3-methyladenine glycosylase
MSNISTTCRSDCRRLVRSFFDQDCHTLCVALLGKVLARKLPMTGEIVGRIVETEAYPGGNDAGSHSYGGRRTKRNDAKFMAPGTAYVYSTSTEFTIVSIFRQKRKELLVLFELWNPSKIHSRSWED